MGKYSLNVSQIWSRGSPLQKPSVNVSCNDVKKPKSECGVPTPRNSSSSEGSDVAPQKSAGKETLRLLQKDIANLKQAMAKYEVAIDTFLVKINTLLSAKFAGKRDFTAFQRKDFGISDRRSGDNEDTVIVTVGDEIAEATLESKTTIFVCSQDAEKKLLDCEKQYYLRELHLRKETLGSLKAVYKSYLTLESESKRKS
jgi:hypothetical protein